MKFFLLVTNGRSGSDFFHSLLDNHDEIVSLPGTLNLKRLRKYYFQMKTLESFVSFFINDNNFLFNSKKNTTENHHKLGENRNQHFIVNKKSFLKEFLNISKVNDNFEIIVKNLHLAYHLISTGKKKNKIKNIFIHVHHVNKMIEFNKFPCEIFYTYRHPISILNSGIQAFFRNKKGNKFTPKTLYFYLSRIINEPFFIKTNHKVHLIKLEKLHLDSIKVLQKISNILAIRFRNTLLQSTFMGKLWWGDNFSKMKKTPFNNDFKIIFNKDNFYNKDFYFLQKILNKEMIKLNYKKINYFKYSILYIMLPLKIESMLFVNLIKKFKFFQSVVLIFYYLKRICLFWNYLLFKKKTIKINIL